MLERGTLGLVTLGLAAATALGPAGEAHACGGFFCNSGGPASTAPTPVVQAAERIIFEQRADGSVRAYIQIRYDQQGGPPIGFSWIVPVQSYPEVGIGDPATFDELDNLTAPQFRFVNNATFAGGGSGGGIGCGASDAGFAAARPDGSASDGTMNVPGVTVWDASRIGDYETAILSGDTAEDLIRWLQSNDYDIPDQATELIDDYVAEEQMFVAFRYAPIGPGTGTLDPIVLTMEGEKPCVPIRITAIASQPVLDVMVMAFGPRRAAPEPPYVEVVPDYSSVRQDFSAAAQTTYPIEVDRAVGRAGDHAWVVEYAGSTDALTSGLTDIEARALVARNAYFTRFYTRFRPDTMTIDPELVFPGGEPASNLHVIDITSDFASADRAGGELRYAATPAILALTVIGWLVRRRRR